MAPMSDSLREAHEALERARAALTKKSIVPSEAALARAVASQVDAALSKLAAPEDAAKQKDLLSVVCHDLKDPLASIVMGAGFLKKALPEDDRSASARRVVDAINRSADRMNQLILDFYDLGKIEAHALTIEKLPHDAQSIARAAAAPVTEQAAQKEVGLDVELPSEPIVFACDREKTMKVLAKVLGNALKFTERGGRITLRVVDAGDAGVRFVVSDTGRGIEPERQKTIFDREANVQRRPRDGPGLGLAIARGLVELHGGTITVESTLGSGSTFTVALPRT